MGKVEQVGGKLKMGFTDFEELRLIMGVPRGQTPRREQSTPDPAGGMQVMPT